MSGGRLGFLVFCLCLVIVFGVWILNQTSADRGWSDVANVAILCFVLFASLAMVLAAAGGEAVFNVMEHFGDRSAQLGNWRGARSWYKRCLWLQETVVADEWRRLEMLGKIALVEEELQIRQIEPDSPERSSRIKQRLEQSASRSAGNAPTPEGRRRGFTVPPAIANSILYRYVFAILFGLIAITYATHGKTIGAVIVLVVGAVLNVYWLSSGKDNS